MQIDNFHNSQQQYKSNSQLILSQFDFTMKTFMHFYLYFSPIPHKIFNPQHYYCISYCEPENDYSEILIDTHEIIADKMTLKDILEAFQCDYNAHSKLKDLGAYMLERWKKINDSYPDFIVLMIDKAEEVYIQKAYYYLKKLNFKNSQLIVVPQHYLKCMHLLMKPIVFKYQNPLQYNFRIHDYDERYDVQFNYSFPNDFGYEYLNVESFKCQLQLDFTQLSEIEEQCSEIPFYAIDQTAVSQVDSMTLQLRDVLNFIVFSTQIGKRFNDFCSVNSYNAKQKYSKSTSLIQQNQQDQQNQALNQLYKKWNLNPSLQESVNSLLQNKIRQIYSNPLDVPSFEDRARLIQVLMTKFMWASSEDMREQIYQKWIGYYTNPSITCQQMVAEYNKNIIVVQKETSRQSVVLELKEKPQQQVKPQSAGQQVNNFTPDQPKDRNRNARKGENKK